MYHWAAIKQTNHTNESYRYFPLRAIFIFWTGSLQQHDISRAPGHMVPQPSLPGVPVAAERLMKCGQDQGVGSRVLGAGYRAEVLNSPACLYLCDCTTCVFLADCGFYVQPLACQHRDCPRCGLARILIVDEHVCVFVLCWEQGGDKFSTLAPDWRQWPFILHCPT